jgi:hypothetical protein
MNELLQASENQRVKLEAELEVIVKTIGVGPPALLGLIMLGSCLGAIQGVRASLLILDGATAIEAQEQVHEEYEQLLKNRFKDFM